MAIRKSVENDAWKRPYSRSWSLPAGQHFVSDRREPRAGVAAVCAARGWQVVQTYRDEGVSGGKGRDRRPSFDRLWKDAARRKFDIVAAWSVDRLGRSLADVATFMVDLKGYGVGL